MLIVFCVRRHAVAAGQLGACAGRPHGRIDAQQATLVARGTAAEPRRVFAITIILSINQFLNFPAERQCIDCAWALCIRGS
jgi:hypothetical protein